MLQCDLNVYQKFPLDEPEIRLSLLWGQKWQFLKAFLMLLAHNSIHVYPLPPVEILLSILMSEVR